MRKLASAAIVAMVGLLCVGLLGLTQVTANADDTAAKRDEDSIDLVLSDEDPDDDDTGNSKATRTNRTNTGASRATRDHTNSRFTKVSRDRDKSRSDKTRDWTRDGGDRTRDHSANKTNDRSRNDTRR
jgi:hypothetical protein